MTDSVANTDTNDPMDELEEEGAVSEDSSGVVPGTDDAAPSTGAPAGSPLGPEALDALDAAAEEARDAADAELVALREEFENLNDRHLRLAAEFNNYRRRSEMERTDLWGRAQSEIVARFLDVLDELQRVAALDLSNATVEAIMEGIDLVDRKFQRMLADSGVEIMHPEGERFDPERMEAMMRVPAESEEEDEMVAQVFQKGYTLKGQLVRPARVSVKKLG